MNVFSRFISCLAFLAIPLFTAYAQTRVVSVGASVTETIFALGAGDHILGVDSSSLYPEKARKLPQVPFQRNLAVEPILALQPDVLLFTNEAGPGAVIQQLGSVGVKLVQVPNEETVEGAREKIRFLGTFFNRESEADSLLNILNGDLATLSRIKSKNDHPLRVLFIYSRGPNVTFVAGQNTSAEYILSLVGARNAITQFEGFQSTSAEAIVAANPDVVLMMERGFGQLGGINAVLNLPGLALTKAGKERAVVLMPDDLLLTFGPRTGKAVLLLHEKLSAFGSLD